jgi:hypothetical protein
MKRNIAPMIVGSTSNCGVRRYCRNVRRADCMVAVAKPAPVSRPSGRRSVSVVDPRGVVVAVMGNGSEG